MSRERINLKRTLYGILRTEFSTMRGVKLDLIRGMKISRVRGKHSIVQCNGITVLYEILDTHHKEDLFIDGCVINWPSMMYEGDSEPAAKRRLKIIKDKEIIAEDLHEDEYLYLNLVKYMRDLATQ